MIGVLRHAAMVDVWTSDGYVASYAVRWATGLTARARDCEVDLLAGTGDDEAERLIRSAWISGQLTPRTWLQVGRFLLLA